VTLPPHVPDQAVGAPQPVRLDPADGVRAAFTTRAGGVSRPPFASLNLGGLEDDPAAVAANRALAAAALGFDAERVVWMRQVHGTRVTVATGPAPSTLGAPDDLGRDAGPPRADAVVTTTPGLALAVLVADCAPVLLADPAARVVAAAHSGRPGTAAGVVPAAVAAMRGRGADPARIVALIGPAVCGRCYEVPPALHDEVAAAVPETSCRTRAGTPGLDIRAGIVAQLRAAGVGRVHQDGRCTVESPELYSYRRDGRTGRFAGYIWLVP
jgi:YfiH family protein